MPRSKTPSFIVELPLNTTAAQNDVLAKRLEAARQVYNACLGEALRRLRLMRESRAWRRARALPKGRARTAAFRELRRQFGFEEFSLMDFATIQQKAAFRAQLGSHEAQALASRAFAAVQQHAFGKRGRPRFKGRRGLHSVEAKTNRSNIRWDGCQVHWKGLILSPLMDETDDWLNEALKAKTKYCRILSRTIGGQERWFVQLVQEGRSPIKAKHAQERRNGVVGLDIGPSTIAFVGSENAKLERFCGTIEQPWRRIRRIERAMDRSRRSTNPDNYCADGTIKRGPKTWNRSRRYRQLASKRAEIERRLAGERKRAHGELANQIIAMGDTIKTEKISYRSFQKNWGRSVKVRAPGMFVTMLARKAESAGGKLEAFPTRTTALSQFCHGCGTFEKKPLSQRTHQCECGIGPVQRDLYSAFLARHVHENELDARQAQKAWPDVEPLLRRAASSIKQSASGRASAASQVKASERIVRQGREDTPSRPQMSYRCVREGCGEMVSILGTPRL